MQKIYEVYFIAVTLTGPERMMDMNFFLNNIIKITYVCQNSNARSWYTNICCQFLSSFLLFAYHYSSTVFFFSLTDGVVLMSPPNMRNKLLNRNVQTPHIMY